MSNKKNIYTYQNINTKIEEHIVNKIIAFINIILESLGVINKEKVRYIRNSVCHVNVNKAGNAKFNLIDRKCNLGVDVIGTWIDKEDLFDLTLDMEKSNLNQLYTLDKLKNNLQCIGINYKLLSELIIVFNDLSNILIEKEIDLNENVFDFINNLELSLNVVDDKDNSIQKVLKKGI